MGKFLPGHGKTPGSGRKAGTTKEFKLSTLQDFLKEKKWDPLRELRRLMPKLTAFQRARINMELAAFLEKRQQDAERARAAAGLPPLGDEERKAEEQRLADLSTQEFIASLPVKIDGPDRNATPDPGADG